MDDPELDPEQHAAALRGLRRINQWSFSARPLWKTIENLAQQRRLSQLRVLDVACGGGDLVLALAERASASSLEVTIDGCDISPVAIEHAAAAARKRGVELSRFFQHDALGAPFPEGYDLIYCTLFLHHLDPSQAVVLMRGMAQAAGHIAAIDDLCRSRFGYLLAQLACRVLSRSPIVHNDGPASVRAAFTTHEALALAAKAGLTGADCRRHWPERFLLTWERPK
jgi:SAM-dependent methyltransferase